jgi:hypothetical protein
LPGVDEIGFSGVTVGAIVNGNERIKGNPLPPVLQNVQILLLGNSVVPLLYLASNRMVARKIQAGREHVRLVPDGIVIEYQAQWVLPKCCALRDTML